MNTTRMSTVVSGLTRFPLRLALLGCLIAGALAVEAGDAPKKSKARSSVVTKQNAAAVPEEKTVMITGSRVPRKVKAGARSADTELNVAVIEKRQIDAMGATNLKETLRKQAFGR